MRKFDFASGKAIALPLYFVFDVQGSKTFVPPCGR